MFCIPICVGKFVISGPIPDAKYTRKTSSISALVPNAVIFFFWFFCAVLHTFLNPCFFHCDPKTHMHTAKQTRLWQWLYDLWLVFSEMDMLILYRTFQTYETFMILLLVSNFVLLFRLYFLMVQTRNIVWSYRKDVFYDFSAESHKNVNE